MDLVVVILAFYRVSEIDWSSSGGSDDFISYDFATGTVQRYPAERIAPVKRHKNDDGPIMFVPTPALDVN